MSLLASAGGSGEEEVGEAVGFLREELEAGCGFGLVGLLGQVLGATFVYPQHYHHLVVGGWRFIGVDVCKSEMKSYD